MHVNDHGDIELSSMDAFTPRAESKNHKIELMFEELLKF